MNNADKNFPALILVLCAAAALAASGCVSGPGTLSNNVVDPFAGCLTTGSGCGGGNLCCPGMICKGGKCSQDATCIGAGGNCSTSTDCCGVAECINGVCDTGACHQIGVKCQASADCCGVMTCQSGICKF